VLPGRQHDADGTLLFVASHTALSRNAFLMAGHAVDLRAISVDRLERRFGALDGVQPFQAGGT
jgi:hypothetical protein